MQRLARDGVTSPEALLIVRCDSGTRLTMPDVWLPDELLTYSSMDIHLFRRAVSADDPPDSAPSASVPSDSVPPDSGPSHGRPEAPAAPEVHS
jgi:hypothetical protein